MADRWDFRPFLDAVGSEAIAPAAGTVVGFVGASGTALLEMAAIHTLESGQIGPEATASVENALATLTHQRSTLVTLAEADAETLNQVYGDTDPPAAETMERRANGIPFTMAVSCSNALEAAVLVADHAVESVLPDLAVGLSFVITASLNAIRTVQTNLASSGDSVRDQYAERIDGLLETIANHVVHLNARVDGDLTRTIPVQ